MTRGPRHPTAERIAAALVRLDTVADMLGRFPRLEPVNRESEQGARLVHHSRRTVVAVRHALRQAITWRSGRWVLDL